MKLAFVMTTAVEIPKNQIGLACQIAKKLDVPLVGIAATEDTMEYYSGGGTSYVSLVTTSIDNAERNLKRCGDAFKAICNEHDVAHEWFGVHGYMLNEWPKLSPYVDLAIVAPPLSTPRLASTGISATIQLSEQTKIVDLSGRCLIAWDGSAQAGRALRAAMPLLHRFTEVDVMLADPDTPNLSRDIANYLAAHNISANINTESSRNRNTAQMILKEAQNTDLVIMGAYGFSVTLEKIFGGVTETMRTECRAPILFAH